MKNIQSLIILAFLVSTLLFTSGCQDAVGNQTGSEFIPDMAHSIAYEANVYGNYNLNTFGEDSEVDRKALTAAKLPVRGTVPRGYAGSEQATSSNGISIPANGHVPYHYVDTEEDRTRAMAEIIQNPFPITEAGIARGKDLYNIFCGICHGEKANGLGYLVRDDGGKYPAAPANFLLDDHINSTNGRYYHAIMYGKNVMGGYADKLSYEERWQVIHYIRSLQAKEKKLEYSEKANTLDNGATPASLVVSAEAVQTEPAEPASDKEQHSGGSH